MTYIETPGWILAVLTIGAIVATVSLLRLWSLTDVKAGRLASIDGLRGLLALSVFFHHFAITYQYAWTGHWTPPKSAFYSLLGSSGVTCFFMITGFLFFGKIKAVQGSLDLNRFFLGRVFRIMPVYVASVVAVYVLSSIKTGMPFLPPIEATADYWLLFQAVPIDGYPYSPLINAGVQWTLQCEWIFYLSLPVIAFGWKRLAFKSWAVFVLAIVSFILIHFGAVLPGTQVSVSSLAPFVLGGLASEVGRIETIRRAATGMVGTVCVLAAVAFLFGAFTTGSTMTAYLVIFAAFVPIALGNALFGLLRLRPMIFLGEISYDVYLFHGIVLFVVFQMLMPKALTQAHSEGRLLSLMIIVGLLVLAVSTVVHLLIERPLLKLGARIAPIDAVQKLAAP